MTSFLRDKNVMYSWGHPFCLIFTWDGKLHHIRSLRVACDLLQIDAPEDSSLGAAMVGPGTGRRSRWKKKVCGTGFTRPDPATIAQERSQFWRSLWWIRCHKIPPEVAPLAVLHTSSTLAGTLEISKQWTPLSVRLLV